MSQIKTAISIDETIFREIDAFAHKIHISRSRLFETAVREWFAREKRKTRVERLNKAVERDTEGPEEKTQASFMRRQQKKLTEGEW